MDLAVGGLGFPPSQQTAEDIEKEFLEWSKCGSSRPFGHWGEALGAKAPWITFLAGTGAIVLRFLAGAELDPNVFRAQMEGARPGWLLRPFFSGPLWWHTMYSAGPGSKLAYWRNRYDDFGSRGLRSHAGARFQSDHVRDGSGARFDILALHKENPTLARDQLGVTLDFCRS